MSFGVLVSHKDNKVWEAFGDLASLVWLPVMVESIVHYGSVGADSLIDHLCVGVVWEPQTEALFDIRVVDANVRSYRACTPHVLCTTDSEKKHKYLLACQNQCKTI